MSDTVLGIDTQDRITTLTLARPDKGNAMNEALLSAIEAFFFDPPEDTRAVILCGQGAHFCAGLDLSEHQLRTPEQTLHHSRRWHRLMDQVQFGGLPVVAAMQGAVIGGGLELATAAHVRIAEPDCIFQLPEGRRGIFVGGGATVRVGRIIGPDRMTEMMLTGRKYSGAEGAALGLAHYLADPGKGAELAQELAARIARNAPLSNYAMIQSVARIDDMARGDGFYTEALTAALTQSSPDAAEGLAAFLEKRPPKFR